MPWSDRSRLSLVAGPTADAAMLVSLPEKRARPDLAEPTPLTPRHYETALGLLECAARALEILYERRDQLECALEDVSQRAEGAVVAAQAKVTDWQRLATSLKSDAQDLERRLAAMQQRAELAEGRLEVERARAEAAERQTLEALGLSQGLHSKILSAFGQGSSAHRALLVAVDQTPGR